MLPYYLACPRRAADSVYGLWSAPDVRAMQRVYAPLRWPVCVRMVRSVFGADLVYTQHMLKGVRVVQIERVAAARPAPTRSARTGGLAGCLGGDGDGDGAGDGPGGEERNDALAVPLRPTILFVPGGAFIADFEAADLFFLHVWVRRTNATLLYVTYEFAPQAPFPTGMEQVIGCLVRPCTLSRSLSVARSLALSLSLPLSLSRSLARSLSLALSLPCPLQHRFPRPLSYSLPHAALRCHARRWPLSMRGFARADSTAIWDSALRLL